MVGRVQGRADGEAIALKDMVEIMVVVTSV
jgi:hypothetical protein